MASRLGVGIAWQWDETRPGWTDQTLTALNHPYWYNWKFDQIARNGYNPMLWRVDPYERDGVTKNPTWDQSIAVARQYGKTRLWLLGNEPEVESKAKMHPIAYYRRANEWLDKSYNGGFPLAAIGGGAIVNTPDGRAWFAELLTTYGPYGLMRERWPYFHIHLYYRGGIAEWVQDWEDFKTLCGPAFRPTIISETNLYTGTISLQMGLMDKILQIAGTSSGLHMVHWYSDRDWFGHWPWSNLRNENGTRTPLGDHFRSKQ